MSYSRNLLVSEKTITFNINYLIYEIIITAMYVMLKNLMNFPKRFNVNINKKNKNKENQYVKIASFKGLLFL